MLNSWDIQMVCFIYSEKNLKNRASLVTVVKNSPASAGDTGSIPGLGGPRMLQSN